MDLDEIIRNGEPENRHLAYVPMSRDEYRVVETLVGMSNNEGGTVVFGVESDDSGEPSTVEDVSRRTRIAQDVEERIRNRADPPMECHVEMVEAGQNRLLGITTPPGDTLRSFRDECLEKPVFPIRRRRGIKYLTGRNITEYVCGINLSVLDTPTSHSD